jgi:structural maintenance of chromosome 4
LHHTAISYNFGDDEIEVLKSQWNEIKARILHLKTDLTSQNPNISIIQTYKHKLQECTDKEQMLKQTESDI